MEETLEKIQLPNGSYVVKLTPQLLSLMINNQKEIFPDYDIVIKLPEHKGDREISKLEVNKGITLREETLKKLENHIFNQKFNKVIE